MDIETVWATIQIIGWMAGVLAVGAGFLISLGVWKTRLPNLERRVDEVEITLKEHSENKVAIAVLHEKIEGFEKRLESGFADLKSLFRDHFKPREPSTRTRRDDL